MFVEIIHRQYRLIPATVEDADVYVDLQLKCLAQTYAGYGDDGFMQRQYDSRDELVEEFLDNVSSAQSRAFLAYDTSADFSHPVGFGLSRLGPLPWESELDFAQVPAGSRELVQLYTLEQAQGHGLGQALLDAVLISGEPAYLHIVEGNAKAQRFYEKNGFSHEGFSLTCLGSWHNPEGQSMRVGRMFRGIDITENHTSV